MNPYWEITELRTHREDYQKTCWHWRKRLRDHEDHIRTTFGNEVYEDYDRYLSTCVWAFEKHYQSLATWTLKRID